MRSQYEYNHGIKRKLVPGEQALLTSNVPSGWRRLSFTPTNYTQRYLPLQKNHHKQQHASLNVTDMAAHEQRDNLACHTTDAVQFLADTIQTLKAELSSSLYKNEENIAENTEAIKALLQRTNESSSTYAKAFEQIAKLGIQSSEQATESLSLLYTLTGRDSFMCDPPDIHKKDEAIVIEIPLDKLKAFSELHKNREKEIRSAIQALSL